MLYVLDSYILDSYILDSYIYCIKGWTLVSIFRLRIIEPVHTYVVPLPHGLALVIYGS